jgi:hypothetical protein
MTFALSVHRWQVPPLHGSTFCVQNQAHPQVDGEAEFGAKELLDV